MSNLIGKRVTTYDGHSGEVVKQYKPTGRGMSVHIKQDNGQVLYCPEEEIMEIKHTTVTETEDLLKQTSEAIQVATEAVIKTEKLHSISGYTIDQLINLFLAGWQLNPPRYDKKEIEIELKKIGSENNGTKN